MLAISLSTRFLSSSLLVQLRMSPMNWVSPLIAILKDLECVQPLQSLLWFALNVHNRQKALAFKTIQPLMDKETSKLSKFSSHEGKNFQKPPQKHNAGLLFWF
jgi:hypothetical protein